LHNRQTGDVPAVRRPGSSPGYGLDCRLVRTLSGTPSTASYRVRRSARTEPVPNAVLGRNRLLPQLWYLEPTDPQRGCREVRLGDWVHPGSGAIPPSPGLHRL